MKSSKEYPGCFLTPYRGQPAQGKRGDEVVACIAVVSGALISAKSTFSPRASFVLARLA